MKSPRIVRAVLVLLATGAAACAAATGAQPGPTHSAQLPQRVEKPMTTTVVRPTLFEPRHVRIIERNLPPYYDLWNHGGPYID